MSFIVKILDFLGLKIPQVYDKEEDHWQSLWRCSLAEFFGTLIFVFLGTASVTSAVNSAPTNGDAYDQAAFVMSVAFAHGFAIAISIYSIGEISGGTHKAQNHECTLGRLKLHRFCVVCTGNINPAVTWALTITRKISIVRGLCYVISQLVGAILASLVLKSLLPATIEARDGLGCHGLHSAITSSTGLQFEITLTFIFIFIVFSTAISPFVGKMAPVSGAEYGPGKLTPLVLGLTILVLHLVGVPFTGASMNPARSFGPAVVAGCWTDHWIYWVGPIIGSTSAAIIAHIFFLSKPEDVAKVFAGTRGDQSLAQSHNKAAGAIVSPHDSSYAPAASDAAAGAGGNPYIQQLDDE